MSHLCSFITFLTEVNQHFLNIYTKKELAAENDLTKKLFLFNFFIFILINRAK
jgi:hypothetical protein